MTIYKCHCGEVHDSAIQSPCPQTFKLSYPGHVRAILTELDRYTLAAALRERYTTMSKRVQGLHDRLLPTVAEIRYGKSFAQAMAHATPAERRRLGEIEEKRCREENAFISGSDRCA